MKKWHRTRGDDLVDFISGADVRVLLSRYASECDLCSWLQQLVLLILVPTRWTHDSIIWFSQLLDQTMVFVVEKRVLSITNRSFLLVPEFKVFSTASNSREPISSLDGSDHFTRKMCKPSTNIRLSRDVLTSLSLPPAGGRFVKFQRHNLRTAIWWISPARLKLCVYWNERCSCKVFLWQLL